MISIIICSYKKEVLAKAIQSIKHTIGLPHEIIAIDNLTCNYGICKAYNIGADKASFNILCFMHEDIHFETYNWGQHVVQHLADKKVGLIGVAGGDTKSLAPSGWASMTFKSEINMVQHYKFNSNPAHTIFETGYPNHTISIKKVACIDGVWMCTRKDVFEQFKFDEITFKGFHGYDIDYSLQVQPTYTVAVVFDVLIHHFSEGALNKEWMDSTLLISQKWKTKLPLSVRQISKKETIRQHWTVMNVFIDKMNELNCGMLLKCRIFFKYSFNQYFHFRNFLHSIKKLLQLKL